VDGSETAEQVIPYALRIGTPFGARYTVLRVMAPLAWGSYEAAAPLLPAPLSRQMAVDYVERLATGLREQGAAVIARVIEASSPGPAIVEYAYTHAADAIAVTTEGAGRVRRLLLGSVMDKIVRSSDVPVLVCNIRRLEQVTDLVQGSVPAAVSTVR
jgi:nucleotide-binding universal stress UspA family protein